METFSVLLPFVRGIHRSPVNSPHKGQWRRALLFSLICAWINGWVNNREAGDLRHHCAHYDVTVMCSCYSWHDDERSLGISSLGTDLVFPEYSGLSPVEHTITIQWHEIIHRQCINISKNSVSFIIHIFICMWWLKHFVEKVTTHAKIKHLLCQFSKMMYYDATKDCTFNYHWLLLIFQMLPIWRRPLQTPPDWPKPPEKQW